MAAAAITRDGLDGVAEVRYMDYRDVDDSGYDAISSIGLTEHIGMKELPNYFASLYAKLRPEGRLLNHCITRPTTTEGVKSEGFIDRYVFPDGELEAVGVITGVMQDAGFEVRHEENLREHYAMTLAAGVATSKRIGTRRWPRWGWSGPGSGGCTWLVRGSASNVGASNFTRSSAFVSATAARRASRCAPTGVSSARRCVDVSRLTVRRIGQCDRPTYQSC